MNKIKDIFIEGLVITIPLFVIFFILYLIYNFFYKFLNFIIKYIPESYRNYFIVKVFVFIGSLLLLILFVIVIGMILKSLFGKIIINAVDKIILNIPLVNTIYKSLKQLFELIFINSNNFFSKPVLVVFPNKGTYSIGFITGEVEEYLKKDKNKKYYSVFVPTVPNPTSGYVIIFPEDDIKFIDLTAEEALKIVLSGGVIDVNFNIEDKENKK